MTTEPVTKSYKHQPSQHTRRKTSVENLKGEEARADEESNTHWATRGTRPGHFNRRSSSLSLDMRDGIVDFKDEDGKYDSGCNHNVLEEDHKCFCKAKSGRLQK